MSSYLQGVRFLFSADLVGSTEFKMKSGIMSPDKSVKWLAVFQHFFSSFAAAFFENSEAIAAESNSVVAPRSINIWRIIGDEILFYSNKLSSEEEALSLVYVFQKLIHEFDEHYKEDLGMGVKGTIWSAGFPIRNTQIEIDQTRPPYVFEQAIPREGGGLSSTVLSGQKQPIVDFLGPDIDLGFRLRDLAQPRRTIISLDASVILSRAKLIHPVRYFRVGWESLKGVYGNKLYPIIWIDFEDNYKNLPQERTAFEESTNPFSKSYLRSENKMTSQEIRELNESYFEETQEYRLAEQYLTDEKMPKKDRDHWGEL